MLTYTVKSVDLPITVLASGALESASSIRVLSDVEGQVAIISLLPRGAVVKKGDVVVELDSSLLKTRRTEQQIVLEQARAALALAKQALQVAESQAESDVKTAELALKFAELDLRKYLDGDYPQELRVAQSNITLAEEELKQAKLRIDYSVPGWFQWVPPKAPDDRASQSPTVRERSRESPSKRIRGLLTDLAISLLAWRGTEIQDPAHGAAETNRLRSHEQKESGQTAGEGSEGFHSDRLGNAEGARSHGRELCHKSTRSESLGPDFTPDRPGCWRVRATCSRIVRRPAPLLKSSGVQRKSGKPASSDRMPSSLNSALAFEISSPTPKRWKR